MSDFGVLAVDCPQPDLLYTNKPKPAWYLDGRKPEEKEPDFGNWKTLYSKINHPPTWHMRCGHKFTHSTKLKFRGENNFFGLS